jgi:hypothetical protein
LHSFLDAKVMARILRQSLATRGNDLSQSECLELVAKQFGLPNWNVLAARIEQAKPTARVLKVPSGWRVTSQTDRRLYRLGLDPQIPGSALIESRFTRESGVELSDQFAAFIQSVAAERFHGQRIRLIADLRTEDADKASLWLRVDKGPGQVLSFDNMLERQTEGPLSGTTGWTRRSIVLDVHTEAASIHLGFLLHGYGRAWVRAMALDAVGEDVPLTEGWGKWLSVPTNLEFAAHAGTAD